MITPVKVQLLVQWLEETNYDPNEIEFLKEGFTNGFSIEYHGPQDRQSTLDDIPLTVGNKTDLWNKLMKEVKAE